MLTVTVHQRTTNPQNPAPPTQYEMTPGLKPFLPSLIVPQQNTEAVGAGGGGGGERGVCTGVLPRNINQSINQSIDFI